MAKQKLTIDQATSLIVDGHDPKVSDDAWEPVNDVNALENAGVFELLSQPANYITDWDNLLAGASYRYFTLGDIPDVVIMNIANVVAKEDGDFDYPETHACLLKWNAWDDFLDDVETSDDFSLDEDWDEDDDEFNYSENNNDRVLTRWDLEYN